MSEGGKKAFLVSCSGDAFPKLPVIYYLVCSSNGKDTRFSFLKYGFDSRTDYRVFYLTWDCWDCAK